MKTKLLSLLMLLVMGIGGLSAAELTASDVSITPAPGEDNYRILPDGRITNITLYVPGCTFAAAGTGNMTITRDGESFATVPASQVQASGVSAQVILPADAFLEQQGTYRVTIPAGFFTVTNSESEVLASPALDFVYVLHDTLSFTADPAPGKVESLDKVVLTFNKPIRQASDNNVVELFYKESMPVEWDVVKPTFSVSADGMQMTIDMGQDFDMGGVWALRMFYLDGKVTILDGETWEGFTLIYEIDNSLPTTAKPEFGSHMSSIEESTIYFPYLKDNKAESILKLDTFSAYYTNGTERVDVDAESVVALPYDWEYASRIIIRPVEPIVAEGDWRVVIEPNSLQFINFGITFNNPLTTTDTWSVKGGFSASILPETGTDISRFDQFRVQLQGAKSIEFYSGEDTGCHPKMVIKAKTSNLDIDYKNYRLDLKATLEEDGVTTLIFGVLDELALLQEMKDFSTRYTYSYDFRIPDGALIINGVSWEGGSALYNYVAPQWLVYPYSGSTVEEISKVFVQYNGEESIEAAAESAPLSVNGISWAQAAQVAAVEPADPAEAVNAWNLTIDPAVTLPGLWSIDVSKLFGDGVQIEYTIPGYTAPVISFDPASGAVLESLDKVEVSVVPGSAAMTVAQSAAVTKDGADYGTAAMAASADGYTLTFSPALTEKGTYQVALDGLFSEEGYGSLPLAPLQYVIAPYEAPVFTFSPESGATLETLDKVSVSVVAQNPILLNADSVDLLKDGAPFGTAPIAATAEGFEITLGDLFAEQGIYTILLNGVFTEENIGVCTVADLVYTLNPVSAVEALEAAEARNVVYSIQGILVDDNADAARLSALPAGLYIVNGRKLVIR